MAVLVPAVILRRERCRRRCRCRWRRRRPRSGPRLRCGRAGPYPLAGHARAGPVAGRSRGSPNHGRQEDLVPSPESVSPPSQANSTGIVCISCRRAGHLPGGRAPRPKAAVEDARSRRPRARTRVTEEAMLLFYLFPALTMVVR